MTGPRLLKGVPGKERGDQYRGRITIKRGLGQFADLRGAWSEKRGWEMVFSVGGEVDTPMYAM